MSTIFHIIKSICKPFNGDDLDISIQYNHNQNVVKSKPIEKWGRKAMGLNLTLL
jgi:hypothetical protein